MPYYVHGEGTNPTLGHSFIARADAYAHLPNVETYFGAKAVVTLQLSEDERKNWQFREYMKFRQGEYELPPWIPSIRHTWKPSDAPESFYGQYKAVAFHFAHLSLKTPGQIAYTPSDEHGYQDRQVVIKTGKYLTQYLSEVFTAEQIQEFVDEVKAYTGEFSIARTPEDCIKVYVNGPRSCMSRRADRYLSSVHPAAVYGGSPDLALAYLGTLDKVTSRCVIWPEKKAYTRIYGDTALESCLRAQGYRKDGSGHGSLEGARIRAIEDRPGVYVMPYVDAAGSAELSDDGKYLILHDSCGYGIDTKVTRETGGDTLCAGLTEVSDEDEDEGSCAHCGDSCDSNEVYCSSCYDDHWSCERCGEDYFDEDELQRVDDNLYCTSCASRYEQTCPVCEDTWFTRNPDSEFCSRHEHYSRCEDCDDPSDSLDEDGHCAECHVADEDEDTDEDTDTPEPAIVPVSVYPSIGNTCEVNGGHIVDVLHLSGALIVHKSINYREGFSITHVLTGLSVCHVETLTQAMHKADLLSIPGVDWSFTEPTGVYATNAYARYCEVRDGLASEVTL